MKWKRFEVAAISPAVTALRGQRKMLPPNDFRKPVLRLIGIHSGILISEPLSVYLLGIVSPRAHGARTERNPMKTKYSLALLIAVLITICAQSPAIDITIGHSGSQVMVRWPQTTTNFSLEVATALKAPIPWYPAPDIATLADGQFLVTNNASAAARFYRLATWDTLFDGTSTAAFTGYQQANFPGTNQWIVTTNRELMTVSNDAPRDISTREQFGDFELFWEWRPIAPTNGNGGVFYRVGDTNLPAYRS